MTKTMHLLLTIAMLFGNCFGLAQQTKIKHKEIDLVAFAARAKEALQTTINKNNTKLQRTKDQLARNQQTLTNASQNLTLKAKDYKKFNDTVTKAKLDVTRSQHQIARCNHFITAAQDGIKNLNTSDPDVISNLTMNASYVSNLWDDLRSAGKSLKIRLKSLYNDKYLKLIRINLPLGYAWTLRASADDAKSATIFQAKFKPQHLIGLGAIAPDDLLKRSAYVYCVPSNKPLSGEIHLPVIITPLDLITYRKFEKPAQFKILGLSLECCCLQDSEGCYFNSAKGKTADTETSIESWLSIELVP